MTPHPGNGLGTRLTMERLTNEKTVWIIGKCNTLERRGSSVVVFVYLVYGVGHKGSRLAGSFVVGLVVS